MVRALFLLAGAAVAAEETANCTSHIEADAGRWQRSDCKWCIYDYQKCHAMYGDECDRDLKESNYCRADYNPDGEPDCRGKDDTGKINPIYSLFPHALDRTWNVCRPICTAGLDFHSGVDGGRHSTHQDKDQPAWVQPKNIFADVVGSLTKCDCGTGCSWEACSAGKNGKMCFTESQVDREYYGLKTIPRPIGHGKPRGCHYNSDEGYSSFANTCAYEAFSGTCRYSYFHGTCSPSPSPSPHMNASAIEV